LLHEDGQAPDKTSGYKKVSMFPAICGAMPLNNSLHLQDVNNYSKNECGQPFKANNPFFHTNKKK